MPSSLKTASNLSIIHIRHHSSLLIPQHTPFRNPLFTGHEHAGSKNSPHTAQKAQTTEPPPHPHNSYQLCSTPLQNTYEKLYSPHTPPSIRYSASSTQHTAFRNSVFTEHEHAGSKNSRSYNTKSSDSRNSRSRTTSSADPGTAPKP